MNSSPLRLLSLPLLAGLLLASPPPAAAGQEGPAAPGEGLVWSEDQASTSEKTDRITLTGLVAEALERNPGVRALRAEWEAASQKPRQAGALADPMLSYTRFLTAPETRVGPQLQGLKLSQKFPGGSKRRLRSEVASHAARAAEMRYRAALREVAFQVRDLYHELYFVQRGIEVTRESQHVLRNLEKVAQVRYATGAAGQEDVLKAQVEISRMDEKLLALRKQSDTLTARLNALRDRPSGTRLGRTSVPRKFRGFDRPLDELETTARANREEVQEAAAVVEQHRAALKLARASWKPDYTIGLGWTQVSDRGSRAPDAGKDITAVMVGVNLPFFQKRRIRAGIEEARSRLEASESRKRAVEDQALFETGRAFFRIDSAQDTVRLYDSALLPQGRQTLEAAAAGYPAGTVSFLDYLDAWRILLRLRLGYHRALADYYQGLAALERAIGSDLTD